MLLRLCQSLQHVSWLVTVSKSAGMISTVWLIHYLGIFLLVGTTLIVDLCVLGVVGRGPSIAQLAGHLFPWMWTGLGLVVASGFIMFGSEATIFYPATAFRIKMLMLLLALAFGVIVQRNAPKWGKLTSVPVGAKSIAFISLVLWIAAILAALEVPTFLPFA